MDGSCPVPGTGNAFLSGVLDYIDCQAQMIGTGGYQALASPGSNASVILTALLTIFIAIFGIRLLIGQTPAISELIVASLKVGIVVLLASSWVAYRVIVYDTVLRGPAELVAAVGSSSALSGTEIGLVDRLQALDDAIVTFTTVGAGRFDLAVPQPSSQNNGTRAVERTPVSDDFSFGFSRIAFLVGTIGSLGLVRLVAGFLLALAPIFAGFLLFETTRGFFMGWARMLVGVALGAFAVTMILAVQIGIIEPWLGSVLDLRAGRFATPSAPVELLVMTLAFAVMAIGAVVIGIRIAFTAHIPNWVRVQADRLADGSDRLLDEQRARGDDMSTPPTELSRAHIIAEAISANQRREVMLTNNQNTDLSQSGSDTRMAAVLRNDGVSVATPLGQSYRRTARRVSSGAMARGGAR